MEALKVCLGILSAVISIWMTFLMLWQLFLILFGFKKKTKDYQEHDPEARFLVLVPAHNEENVIGDIVRNLQEMDYPRELYDFYIIADNCTDGTADRARALGAQVIETRRESPEEPTGKPVALKKALDALGDYAARYDLMMIFDADNLMDRNMFREVNSQYIDKDKPDMIQCYLGVKNKKGVVAWFDYVSFTLNNRFFMLAKHRMGVNSAIGGTGYAITTAYLRDRGGWTTRSLTEDFEIQVEATIQRRRILWNHNTRVYDEKPTRFCASVRQKIRWGQGYWYVIAHNMGKLWRAFFRREIRMAEFLSILTHMCNITAYPCLILQGLIALATLLIGGKPPVLEVSLHSALFTVLMFIYSYYFLFFYADWTDNGLPFTLKRLVITVGGFFLNMIACFCNQTVGLIRCRDQANWVKTEHRIGVRNLRET